MAEPQPSPSQLRRLYEAAERFKNLAAWNWVSERDLFGVRDPATSQIGYCTVLGGAGELFALVVYRGTEGLQILQKIASGLLEPDDPETVTQQSCLMASFEDREDLESADRKTIKTLGLKFRGRGAWPLFRSYRTGFFPWYLTKAETVYLTQALEQATDVCLRSKDDGMMLVPCEDGHYLVRVRKSEEGWLDEWLRPAPADRGPEIEAGPLDEVRLARIKRGAARRETTWEFDLAYAPMPIREGERPYYPPLILCAERESGIVLDTEFLGPASRLPFAATVDRFLEFAENAKALPTQIAVRHEELLDLLEPAASRLGIRIDLEEELPLLEDFKAGFLGSIGL